MKKHSSFNFYLLSLAAIPFLLQGCDAYVYDHDNGWHHEHHGWIFSADSDTQTSAEALALDYGIGNVSAEKIVTFAGNPDSSNQTQSLEALGVSSDEMAPLQILNMPTEQTIQKIATSLGEDSSKIENVFSGFITDVKAERSN